MLAYVIIFTYISSAIAKTKVGIKSENVTPLGSLLYRTRHLMTFRYVISSLFLLNYAERLFCCLFIHTADCCRFYPETCIKLLGATSKDIMQGTSSRVSTLHGLLDDDNACDYGILARCIVCHHMIYARCYALSLLLAAVPSECAASRRAAPHQLSAA